MENKFSYRTKNERAQIKLALYELGLTQKKIANSIGVAEGFVSEILRGKKKGMRAFSLIKTEIAREILRRKNGDS